jgi:L-threonylcarbamoyladenylate synthase
MQTIINNHIETAADFLKSGEVVAIPTETVYGLAANAWNADAILKIFETKRRPLFNPLILHVANKADVHTLCTHFPEELQRLTDAFWPGPLTILLPKSELVHDLITAGSPLVAVRIPDHPLTLKLLQAVEFPLAAPSANLFGTISPTTAWHVLEQFDGIIPAILDGGPCKIGLESTIIKMEGDQIIILRTGGITPDMIEEITGVPPVISREIADQPEAPGMLKSHYAPNKPLFIGHLNDLIQEHPDKKLAVLAFGSSVNHPNIVAMENLSEQADLHEAALHLFAMLRKLDASNAEIILAPMLPATGIGLAINDRLERAAAN